jgi:hypothetical protein
MAQVNPTSTPNMPHAVFHPVNMNFTTINKYENHAEINGSEALQLAKEARIRAIENSEPVQKREGMDGSHMHQNPPQQNSSNASERFESQSGAWDGENGFWSPREEEIQSKERVPDVKYERKEGAWDGEAGFWTN